MIYVDTLPQTISPIENYPLKSGDGSIVTAQDILDRLTVTIPFNYTMYIIGGMVNRGYTNNDIDIWIVEKINKSIQVEIEKYFIRLFRCSIHIINVPINEEKWAPVYLYKIYANGLKINY